MNRFRIVDVRCHLINTVGVGGDYLSREPGHWMVDGKVAGPLSHYPAHTSLRDAAGPVLGGVLLEIEDCSGRVGIATGVGGLSTCAIVEGPLKQVLMGADPRDISRLWDMMFRTVVTYGRGGLALLAISVADLALWDLLGHLRQEPVYKLIGGAVRNSLAVYCTGPRPGLYKELGFFGAKIPLSCAPSEGASGFRENLKLIKEQRRNVGEDFPLMLDCFMSLDVRYALELATALKPLGIFWIEEALMPDEYDGYRRLREAAPWVRWVSGEHEYTRYGFRRLIQEKCADVLQPDLMWVGGLTEALRIGALAAAYDIEIVPHAGGVYSYHFAISQPQVPFVEYCITSADGIEVAPVFGDMFSGEPLPLNGSVVLTDAPGWGLSLDTGKVGLSRVSWRKVAETFGISGGVS